MGGKRRQAERGRASAARGRFTWQCQGGQSGAALAMLRPATPRCASPPTYILVVARVAPAVAAVVAAVVAAGVASSVAGVRLLAMASHLHRLHVAPARTARRVQGDDSGGQRGQTRSGAREGEKASRLAQTYCPCWPPCMPPASQGGGKQKTGVGCMQAWPTHGRRGRRPGPHPPQKNRRTADTEAKALCHTPAICCLWYHIMAMAT